MINKNFTQEVLGKIEEEKIIPKPRWFFLAKDYLLWFFSAISLLVGALAVAIIIFLFRYNDWSIYKNITNSWLEFTLLSLPYFWIILFIIFILATEYNLRLTKKGYKYSLISIIFAVLSANIVFGFVLYNIGVGQAVEEIFLEKVPFYEEFVDRRGRMWHRPEHGLLAGRVVFVIDEEKFNLEDNGNNSWLIYIDESSPDFEIIPGLRLKLMGRKISDQEFRAKKIMPFFPMENKLRFFECPHKQDCENKPKKLNQACSLNF